MDGETAVRSGKLWSGLVVQKLGLLAFSFALGRAGGAAAVGVMASVLALVWVLSTLAGMGLPDRMTFVSAEAAERGEALGVGEGRLHSTYVLSLTLLTLALLPWAPWLGGHGGEDMAVLARCLVVGASLQGLAAPTFCACRGLGEPRWEIMGLVPMAFVLACGLLVDDLSLLGAVWVAGGAVPLMVAAVAARRVPGLWPTRPARPGALLRAGLPYLGFGVGAWLVGNVDVLLARGLHEAGAVGQLQVGTMVLRAAGSAAWVVATLSLHRLGTSSALPWSRLGGIAVVMSVAAGIGAWVLMPVLAWGHGMAPAEILQTTTVSALCALPTLGVLLLLPLGAARRLGWTLRCIGAGVAAAGLFAVLSPLGLGVSDCIVAAAAGQVVVAVGLVLGLRAKSGEVGLSAG